MKISKLAFAITLSGLFVAGNAYAQNGLQPNPSVQRTSFAYDNYYADEEDDVASPSDASASCDAGGGCDSAGSCDSCGVPGAADCGCNEELDCGLPWTLQQYDNCRRIEYGGWISAGITKNSGGNGRRFGNSQLSFRNDPNLNLDQANFFVQRLADTGGCGWDWGFRVDVMAGVDAPDTQAFNSFSWDSNWDWSSQYGSALPQAYAELAYNDLSVKIGHFYTILGYESVPAPNNFFYSHSYSFSYAGPFTQTGFLADYKVNDQLSVQGGWTNGWDAGFNNENEGSTFLGSVRWKSCDERVSLSYAVNVGDWGNGARGVLTNGDIYMHTLLATLDLGSGWDYVFESNLGQNTGLVGPDREWYGISNYLIKEINCCWSYGLRLEWFRDDDGVRVDRAGLGGAAANYYEITAGVNWRPHTNVTIRPEIRFDWKDGQGSGPRFDPVRGAYTANSMFTFGVDGILTF